MSYYDDISRSSTPLDRAISAARRRPEALLLLGAGFVLMMSRSKLSGMKTDDLRTKANSAKDYVGDLAQRAGSYANDASNSVVSRASDIADQTQRLAQSNLEHYLREQPMTLGILSLAVGAIIGAALPETEVENRTLGAQRDFVALKAGEAVSNQIDQLKTAASEMGEKVMGNIREVAASPKTE